MGPSVTPPTQNPVTAPPSISQPPSHKKRFDKRVFAFLSILILFTGMVSGYLLISSGIFFKPRASTSGTTYWSKPGTGYSMSYDGRYVTINATNTSTPIKLVNYKANQPYWGSTWQAIGSPSVVNVSNGSKVEVPCGFFQSDLIPQSATVILSPSTSGQMYGPEGMNVLLAAVNGTRTCTTQPTNTPTPKLPTATPKPSPTPTRVPVCGSTCTSDSQCPVGLKCFNTIIGTFTNPTGKCVLAKCLVEGTVCSADKCTVMPPTPTPTTKPSSTPPPTPTNACPKPNPVKNLRINCPICNQT